MEQREIKFRAWWDGRMSTADGEGRFVIDIQTGEVQRVHYGTTPFNLTLPQDVVLMQFTGLHDKNSEPIFEGDIVKVYDDVYPVEYIGNKDYPAFELKGLPGDVDCNGLSWGAAEGELEVVGNVFETPELLNQA